MFRKDYLPRKRRSTWNYGRSRARPEPKESLVNMNHTTPAGYRFKKKKKVSSSSSSSSWSSSSSSSSSPSSSSSYEYTWDYTGTPHVPVYVMLPLGIINMECDLVDVDHLKNQLKTLKSINVDGVTVETWWGIVEANEPQRYNWKGYKQLYSIVRDLDLKLQVVMSFHEAVHDVRIPLPTWIQAIGVENPDIYFTDKDGNRNTETLTWGIDEEPVLRGRTAVEVYFQYMQSFQAEFNEFIKDGNITRIQIGLGARGELCYPSCPAKHRREFFGVGKFQCYDRYLRKCLEKAAEARGHSIWGRPPDNASCYFYEPQDTGFFCDGGDYNSLYGRFFLKWYSQYLIDHGDRVLTMANLAFEGAPISVKLSGIYWWYETASHADELTAGIYNLASRDGYTPIASMLKKHKTTLNFTYNDMSLDKKVERQGLLWQVRNAAWDAGIPIAIETALPSYDSFEYYRIVEHSKRKTDPDHRHISAFNYVRLDQNLLKQENLREFQNFVQRMHGEAEAVEAL